MLEQRIKQSKEYRELEHDIVSGGLSHAYLVLGADINVRKLYTELISERILCKFGGCGECPTCKKIQAATHGDIKFYNADGKMKVADAEAMVEAAYVKGWESETKLFFIDNAEALTPQVQNKLLKVYEEPPQGVIIFLLAGSEGGLLQTVLSRAKKCYLPTFRSEAVFEELLEEGYPRKTAEVASVFSNGRFDKAYGYVKDDSYNELYDVCFFVLRQCKKSSDIPTYSGNAIFSKDNIANTLDVFEVIFRDVLTNVTKSGTPYMTLNRDYDIEQLSVGFSGGGVAMALLALVKARKQLASYVSNQSVADTVLFDILEAKYKWQ